MIGVLHPGEMGAELGRALRECGHEVGWISRGRSDATRERYRAFLADTLNGILTKPVSANDLWTALANLVNQRSTSSRPPPRE